MWHDLLLPLVESGQIAVRIIYRMLHDHIRKILADKRVTPLVDVAVKITVPSGFVPG